MEHFIELFCQLLLPNWQKYRILFKVHNNTFQKSEQIFEENKIDQDKCGAEAWGYASAGKFMISVISWKSKKNSAMAVHFEAWPVTMIIFDDFMGY